MNLETEHLDGISVITPVARRLDASVAAAFRQGVSEEINRTTGGLVIDFSRVDFIDSSCLGTLIALFKQMNGKGEMALCSLNSNIMNMSHGPRIYPLPGPRRRAGPAAKRVSR